MFVKENKRLTQDIYALVLTGEFPYDQIRPGQFVNLLVGEGKAHPLRRPFSIASFDKQDETLTLVYRVVGDGTKWMSNRGPGSTLDLMGPLGQGFPLPQAPSQVLVVGGGVGIPPLYQLVKELAASQAEVDIVLGFRNQADVFWVNEFAHYGKVTVCTEDGSCGIKGFVTAALPQAARWSAVYSCGPKPMLRALKEHFSGTDMQGYVSLEERMACGVGACWGCTCTSSDGLATKRICKEGPVFAWEEVAL